jgi:fumarylpyruvate hydrolase
MTLLFYLPAAPSVPVLGSEARYPVRRIFCVGRNYAAHALELGNAVDREAPIWFNKAPAALCLSGKAIPYPPGTSNCHYEMEFVVAIGAPAFRVAPEDAMEVVYGYAAGLDMTRRDLQNGMAAEKKPWEIGKSFDHAAVLGPIHPVAKVGHLAKGAISLAVNGAVRQNSDLDKMIWSVAEQIAKLSEAFKLKPGDIIYSGTPENVGPVVKGDVLLCKLDGLPDMSIRIV